MKGSGHYGHGNQKRKDGMPWVEAAMGAAKAIGGAMSKKKEEETPGKYASPAKSEEGRKEVASYASGEKEVTVKGDKRSSAELTSLSEKAREAGSIKAADALLAKANKKKEEKGRAQEYLNTTA